MSEFKLHRLMRDLVEATGSDEPPETYLEFIQQTQPRVGSSLLHSATQTHVKKLSQSSPDPQGFLAKYEELKSKNMDCLASFVDFLYLISEDKKLKHGLEKNSRKSALEKVMANSGTSQSSTRMDKKIAELTKDDVPHIMSRLKEVASRFPGVPERREKHTENQGKARHPNYIAPVSQDWSLVRPNIMLDFVLETPLKPFSAKLGPIPTNSLQVILIQELLSIMEGVEGMYIVPNPLRDKYETRTFTISHCVDPSLKEAVKEILPLARHFSIVVRFIEERQQFKYGQVNHALSAAMAALIKEYMVFVSQLENLSYRNNFSLQSLNFYIRPIMDTSEILAHIATAVCKSDAVGGKVLSLLHEMTISYGGNAKSQEVCLYLMQMACTPYMEILEQWIYKGVICDPFHEFLVEDNEVIQYEEQPIDYSADYWEKRYMIRRERIPLFLEGMSDVILRTGKYLNVIRQCGKIVKAPQAESLMYTLHDRQYAETIEEAYRFASKTLLELLMDENDLMGRLRSVKHYFLLDQGDFIVQFMDSCEGELSKNIDDIVPTRLETLLDLALRMSAANTDPYKDDMRMELLPYDLIFQMFKILSIETLEENEYRLRTGKKELTGLLSFSFGYEVKWPVSLVLNRKAIACYQMIFRHLFYCKHIERLLCRVWLRNKLAKTFSLKASQMYVAAFALRQRMLDCVQNLEYYMMIEVIEPNWVAFWNKMLKVSNVDEVLVCHSDFLDLCLKDCMLTNPDLLQNVYHLLDVCVEFYEFIQSQDAGGDSKLNTSNVGDALAGRSYLKKRIVGEADTFEEAISKLDTNFTSMLVGLLSRVMLSDRHNNNGKLINLVYRLDFNGFYKMDLKMGQNNDWEPPPGVVAETSG
ncbi:gamma-tubulin complex component 2 [Anabrus simplex]|uniref:gamma-tubulin complex component 2 n=1 Tax=Anabrus simplex TaxID=316456 RepID=UPI0035A30501